jgi:Ni/Fe-hydrogenase subunit HybB-like protein
MALTVVKLPRGVRLGLWVLLYAGAITFLLAIKSEQPQRAWQIFLVNFLFWSGLAQGGLAFAATYYVSGARWGATFRWLAQGLGVFLPVSLLCFFVLFAGADKLLPWVRHPVPDKAVWLNVPFLFSRDTLGLFILYGCGMAYLFYALRPMLGAALEQHDALASPLVALLTKGWRGYDVEQERSQQMLAFLVPIYLILYAVVFSLLAFDWIMSLDPHWYSSLFGAYFFISSFYLGLAATAILAIWLQKSLPPAATSRGLQFHDLGKLLFGFCLVTGDFFWSQYVVIWYGNIPEETHYIILRIHEMPWAVISWLVLILCYVGPFIVLLSRWVKEHARPFLCVTSSIVIGMWLERYLLVVPSLWPAHSLPLGVLEVLITLGFAATFGLTYLAFLDRVPFPVTPQDALTTTTPGHH